MAGYADAGQVDKAWAVLDQIKATPGLAPDISSYNVLLNALAKQGRTQVGRAVRRGGGGQHVHHEA